MKKEIWETLDKIFSEFPIMKAESVEEKEIRDASIELGVKFPDDYCNFLMRYGGATIGHLSIIGLRRAKTMSVEEESIITTTNKFRNEGWLGVKNWAIFSIDQSGNPYGFDDGGNIWLSDHDSRKIVHISNSFETFLIEKVLHPPIR